MKTVAYLRVSTRSQDLANQKLAILDYAQQKQFTVDRFIELQSSSLKVRHKERVGELLDSLKAGDRLIVSELSRLGRSLGQVIQIVDTLVHRKVRFTAVKEGITFEGKQDLQTKVMIALFGLFAEVERDLISERTKEGLVALREPQGKMLGRPKGTRGKTKLDGKEQDIQAAIEQGCFPGLDRQDHGRIPDRPLPLHQNPQDRSRLKSTSCAQNGPISGTGSRLAGRIAAGDLHP